MFRKSVFKSFFENEVSKTRGRLRRKIWSSAENNDYPPRKYLRSRRSIQCDNMLLSGISIETEVRFRKLFSGGSEDIGMKAVPCIDLLKSIAATGLFYSCTFNILKYNHVIK
jgi:hypothetical protein